MVLLYGKASHRSENIHNYFGGGYRHQPKLITPYLLRFVIEQKYKGGLATLQFPHPQKLNNNQPVRNNLKTSTKILVVIGQPF